VIKKRKMAALKLQAGKGCVCLAVLLSVTGTAVGVAQTVLYLRGAATQTVLYVAPGGNDAARGTSTEPLATLEGARDKVRSLLAKGRMSADIEVRFAAGDYAMAAPVEFGPEDSGRNGHQVIYRYTDAIGSARFVGGLKVDAGWIAEEMGIYKVHIGTESVPHTLYEEGQRVRKARYPNYVHNDSFPTAAESYLVTTAGGTVNGQTENPTWVQYAEGDVDPGTLDMKQLRINVFPWGESDWHRMLCKVVRIEPETRRIVFDNNNQLNPQQGKQRYFLEDDRSFLNAPGEFFFDEETGWLYLIPWTGTDPNGREIVVPVTTTLVRVVGSPNAPVHDIRFEGLHFNGTNLESPAPYLFWFDAQAMISVKYAQQLGIVKCRLANGGRSGISLVDCSHVLIYGNLIQHMGMNGVLFWKSSMSLVSNNKIHDIGTLQLYAECIGLFGTHNIEVSYCELFNSARYALTVRGNIAQQYNYGYSLAPPSFNNRFHHLKSYGLCQDSGDTGGIHAAQINGIFDPFYNIYDQITIDGCRAVPSMKDYAPDGIFLDWPSAAMYQRFSNIKTTEIQSGNGLRSNGVQNDQSALKDNVSWQSGFDDSRMDYATIGLTSDFPAEYGGQGAATQIPPLKPFGRLEFARYRFENNYDDSCGFSTINQVGNPEFSDAIKREGSSSLYFDGEEDLISLTTDLENDFTVSLWARYQEQTEGISVWRPIVYSGTNIDSGAAMISTYQAGKKDPGSLTYGVDSRKDFDVGFDDGEWHFLTLIKNGQLWRAYHNGMLLGGDMIALYKPDPFWLQIGGDRDAIGWKRNFRGYVDDVRTWNYAMTEEEVQALYQSYP